VGEGDTDGGLDGLGRNPSNRLGRISLDHRTQESTMLISSNRPRRPIVVPVAIVAALTMAVACGDDDDDDGGNGAGSGGVTVTAANFAFDPSSLNVAAGATVTLRNEDDVEHSLTIDDPEVDAEAQGGEEANVTPPAQAGTYDFYCRYPPDRMKGTLTVE